MKKLGKYKKVFFYSLIVILLVAVFGQWGAKDRKRLRLLDFDVQRLYNVEQNDLDKDFKQEDLEEVTRKVEVYENKRLNPDNKKKFKQIKVKYEQAKEMVAFETAVNELFDEDEQLKEEVTSEQLAELEEQLKTFDTEKIDQYIKRQEEKLATAKDELTAIETAISLVDALYVDELETNK